MLWKLPITRFIIDLNTYLFFQLMCHPKENFPKTLIKFYVIIIYNVCTMSIFFSKYQVNLGISNIMYSLLTVQLRKYNWKINDVLHQYFSYTRILKTCIITDITFTKHKLSCKLTLNIFNMAYNNSDFINIVLVFLVSFVIVLASGPYTESSSNSAYDRYQKQCSR